MWSTIDSVKNFLQFSRQGGGPSGHARKPSEVLVEMALDLEATLALAIFSRRHEAAGRFIEVACLLFFP